MSAIGKRVGDELYVHLSAIQLLADTEHRNRIESALMLVPEGKDAVPNVAKLNARTGKLSLLAYPGFEQEPFPELRAAWTFAPGELKSPAYRHYQDSLNPPILQGNVAWPNFTSMILTVIQARQHRDVHEFGW